MAGKHKNPGKVLKNTPGVLLALSTIPFLVALQSKTVKKETKLLMTFCYYSMYKKDIKH